MPPLEIYIGSSIKRVDNAIIWNEVLFICDGEKPPI